MLTLAFLMKKVHLQLLEDIRLIWPLQTDLTTNPHSFPSRSIEWFMYLNRAIIGRIVSLLTKFIAQWNRIPNKQLFFFPSLPQLCLASSAAPCFKMKIKTCAIKGSGPDVDERRCFIRHWQQIPCPIIKHHWSWAPWLQSAPLKHDQKCTSCLDQQTLKRLSFFKGKARPQEFKKPAHALVKTH